MRNKQANICKSKKGAVVSRRRFLAWAALAALPGAGLGLLSGCAADPVTGRKQLMLMSREQEISVDRQQSPFQFSSDYGITQDKALNQYIDDVGKKLLPGVHRRDMPYSFHCVNATYVNAYAFPGGSIAATRGILLELGNEAELAALLGHELGHVNARHTAEQQTKGQVSSVLIGGLSILASTQGSGFGDLAQQMGSLGQGLFLARYSRENEREADSLGHEYMTGAGYNSKGFVSLMEMLNTMNTSQPSSFEMLFATHPMSRERLDTAVHRDSSIYKTTHEFPLNRDRFMDHTAGLRQKKNAIKKMQEGEKYLAAEKIDQAEAAFKEAVNMADEDYTAQVLGAKCMMLRKKYEEAAGYANRAKALYPEEVQGHYLSGLAYLSLDRPEQARMDFKTCNDLLPGNPQVTFYQGYAMDKGGQFQEAAGQYTTYLKQINYASNKYSQYAVKRLKTWGYVK